MLFIIVDDEEKRKPPGLVSSGAGGGMVEVAGVEPASGNPQLSDPTCVVTD
jgi:hypothetical protein